MTLDAPPEIPLITEPSTFAERAQDWVVWQADELYPFLVESSGLLGLSLSATSTTSNTIGTGSKSFTVQTGKGFTEGQSLSIARTSAPTNRMFCVVVSYNSGTGALVVTSQAFEGSGTFTDWSIAPAFNGVISTDQITDLSITTAKIADANVTTEKIANAGITAAKLASDAIAASHLSGYTLSTAGSSATMSIAAGQAADSTNSAYIGLAASIAKTTSAWAVGTAQGGLDTGAIANSTWYHFYAIRRPDTGLVDVIFSTNAALPSLPANYTQYRRIGSGLTNGSAQWVKFVQNGDTFLWDVPTIDADAVNPGTASVSRALTVPNGIVVEALLTVGGFNGTGQFAYAITPLSVADTTAQNPVTAALTGTPTDSAVSNGLSAWQFRKERCFTDTSRQIRTKLNASGAADRLGIITRGWIDTRGK